MLNCLTVQVHPKSDPVASPENRERLAESCRYEELSARQTAQPVTALTPTRPVPWPNTVNIRYHLAMCLSPRFCLILLLLRDLRRVRARSALNLPMYRCEACAAFC